jgi:hypothetical protein
MLILMSLVKFFTEETVIAAVPSDVLQTVKEFCYTYEV